MITVDLAAVLVEPVPDWIDPQDRRGKEGITAADVRDGLAVLWAAHTEPEGLLAGTGFDRLYFGRRLSPRKPC